MFLSHGPAAILALMSSLATSMAGAAPAVPYQLGVQSGSHEPVVEKLLASYEVDQVDTAALASELGRIESAVGPLFRILAESGIPSEWTPEDEGCGCCGVLPDDNFIKRCFLGDIPVAVAEPRAGCRYAQHRQCQCHSPDCAPNIAQRAPPLAKRPVAA